MKIGPKEIYESYNKEFVDKKTFLLSEKENYTNTKDYLLDNLKTFEHYIVNFTNLRYNHLPNITRTISERVFNRVVDIAGVNPVAIRRCINMIAEINNRLEVIEKELLIINQNVINEDIHRKVLNMFNKELSDEILKGYIFKIGRGLGVIKIKKVLCDTRIKKRINWNESKKLKAELELQGKLPFKVIERDENGKNIADNGGVNWFVYFDNAFDFLWHWSKNRNIVFNSAYYKFKPTIYNNTSNGGGLGNINRLAQLKASNSEILKNFL